nr:hypothetical protein [uncultured Campylobacter sp.]
MSDKKAKEQIYLAISNFGCQNLKEPVKDYILLGKINLDLNQFISNFRSVAASD